MYDRKDEWIDMSGNWESLLCIKVAKKNSLKRSGVTCFYMKFNFLVYEMLFIKEGNSILNTQTDSICAKLTV